MPFAPHTQPFWKARPANFPGRTPVVIAKFGAQSSGASIGVGFAVGAGNTFTLVSGGDTTL